MKKGFLGPFENTAKNILERKMSTCRTKKLLTLQK